MVIDSKKASRLRKKLREGKATSDEKALLANYEANKKPRGRPPAETAPEPASTKPASETAPPTEPPPSTAASEPEPKPRKPKPLPKRKGKAKGKRDNSWREKYAQASASATREETCVLAADLFCKLLGRLNSYTESKGVKPWVSDDILTTFVRPAAIVTADDVLPDELVLEPHHVVVGTACVAATQALMASFRSDDNEDSAPAEQHRTEPEPEPEPAPARPEPPTNGRPSSPPVDDEWTRRFMGNVDG